MANKNKIKVGNRVRVIPVSGAPIRYEGRTAEVVLRRKAGRGWSYGLDFTHRDRVEPLFVSSSQIELV